MARPGTYVWQQSCWPQLTYDAEGTHAAIAAARRAQGALEGKAGAIGLDRNDDLLTEVLSAEVMATAAIEGEKLDPAAVRSSVLRQLRLDDAGPHDRQVDGLIQVITDASEAFGQPLDHDRLVRWQSALFPGGTSGITRIAVGRYRDHADPMQIVSGRPGRETVHYEPPPSGQVVREMDRFLAWFAATTPEPGQAAPMDGLARAALAHLWFESIHPFADGNGRVGRAIVDMAIAQDQGHPLRLYSLSRQLLAARTEYYDELNRAQRGSGDASSWVAWFATQIALACESTIAIVDRAIEKSRFWTRHAALPLKERQRKVLQRLLDAGDGGFLGGLNAEKYMKLTGVSKATATRDLGELVAGGLLWTAGQGKALRYHVRVPGWTHGLPGGREEQEA